MATIIEVQDSKIEHLTEYVEKVMKYGKKLMECIEEIDSKGDYSERYDRKYGNRYGSDKKMSRYDEEEYGRYY